MDDKWNRRSITRLFNAGLRLVNLHSTSHSPRIEIRVWLVKPLRPRQ